MTDAHDILAHFEIEPDSEILAAMLTDALMEERGMLRSEADRHVHRVRKDARNAKQMDAVAAIISEGGERWFHLKHAIRVATALGEEEQFTVFVMTGDHPPESAVRTNARGTPTPSGWWSVGLPTGWALFVLRSAGLSTEPPKLKWRKK